MFRRILVPLDGSTLSEAVVPHVEKLISETNAEVTLLRVAEILAPIGVARVEFGALGVVVSSTLVGDLTIEEGSVFREGESHPQAELRF
jgi:nucleotide-binding universal stress UspA family protein